MQKLLTISSILAGDDDAPVELWHDDANSALLLRVWNEAGFSATDIDLDQLSEWMKSIDGIKYSRVASELRHRRD